jgi:hypothetical protein
MRSLSSLYAGRYTAGQQNSVPAASDDAPAAPAGADLAALLATFESIGLADLTGQALLKRYEEVEVGDGGYLAAENA